MMILCRKHKAAQRKCSKNHAFCKLERVVGRTPNPSVMVRSEFDLHVVLKGELLTVEPDFSEQDWYDEENSGK